jgi:hypothetical protein
MTPQVRNAGTTANRGVRTLLLFVLGVLAGAGCGPATGTISGKVKYNGQPLTVGVHTVTFLSVDGSVHSCGVEPDGSYTLRGVPAGRVRITIQSFPSPQQLLMAPGEDGRMKSVTGSEAPARPGVGPGVPGRYKNPDQSGLRYDVKRGSQTFDIELSP